MGTKKVELTSDQYRQLLKLVYLGNWMQNAHLDEEDEVPDEIEQLLYAYAPAFGCDDIVDFDAASKKYYPSSDLEEECDGTVQVYDDFVFWEELAWRLAERDFERKYDHAQILCMTENEIMREKQNLADRYFEEFSVNGVKSLNLSKPLP